MKNLLAQILYHGAAIGQAGIQGIAPPQAASSVKSVKKRKGGCTPCAAKKEGARLIRKSGV